jgi:signal transduction histidine kinase
MEMKGFVRAALVAGMVFFQYIDSCAQPSDIVRLRKSIEERQAKPNFAADTAYIDTLDSLAFGYYRISADSVFLYSRMALEYSKKAGYGKGESNSLRLIGNGYKLIGDYAHMISYYHEALVSAEKAGDSLLIAKASINMAMFYEDIKKDEEARILSEKARRIFERVGDSLNLDKTLTSISNSFMHEKKEDSALWYYQRASELALAMKNEYLVVTNDCEMGFIFLDKGQYKEALDKFLRARDYFSHTDDKIRQTRTDGMLALAYFKLKDYPAALKYGQQGLELAIRLRSKSQMADLYGILADIYEVRKDYPAALRYSKLYKTYSDSLFDENTRKATDELEARYEYQEKEKLLKEEQARKDLLHRELVRKEQLEIYIGALVILFLSSLTFVLFRSRRLLKSKNEKIESQKEEVEHLAVKLLLNNQEKDMLFGIIAHDLRAPLHSLNELMNLLKGRALSEAQINIILQELRQDLDYSVELINNLVFWAHSQLDGLVVTPVELHLRQLAENLLDQFRKKAAAKNIELKNEIDPALEGYADKNMIELAVRNLLSNAVKFCRTGDTISLKAETSADAVVVCVADTGIGIEKDTLNKILQKKSISSTGTAQEKGTGLGLLLCQEFVEKNNGRFWVESQPGQGSKFYFTISRHFGYNNLQFG